MSSSLIIILCVTVIKQRSEKPLLSPEFAFEFGTPPYTCNVPNVIFLEAARPLGNDTFEVFLITKFVCTHALLWLFLPLMSTNISLRCISEELTLPLALQLFKF